MRTRVKFNSDAFPPYPGEDEDINPGIWGKRLAEFISTKLRERGIESEEFYAEDWGWEIPIKNKLFPIFMGCSNASKRFGNEFVCFIEPNKPVVRRWIFKRISTAEDVERVANALDSILKDHAGVSELHWD